MKKRIIKIFLWFSVAALPATAQENPQTGPAEESVPSVVPFHHRLPLPLKWKVTYTRRQPVGVASFTETYREEWSLEQDHFDRWTLISPRARVTVFPLGKIETAPIRVKIGDLSLGRLLGLVPSNLGFAATEDDLSGFPLIIQLTGKVPRTMQNEISLHFSEEDHFNIFIDPEA